MNSPTHVKRQPRRVYFFTDSSGFGGAEKAMLMLLAGLNRCEWSPTLLLHESRGIARLAKGAEDLRVDVEAVPPMPDGAQGARAATSFVRMLRSAKPHVFHAHLTWPLACKYALAGAITARIPAVIATHQLIPRFTLTAWTRLQQRLIGRRVDQHIAVSEDMRQQLQDLFEWPPEKITVVHNAVAPSHEDVPIDLELRSLLLRGRRTAIVVPARLDPLKGHDVVIEAAASLQGTSILFAGEGPERSRLESRVRQLKLENQVTFLGFRDDLSRVMRCADVVVLPSYAEGLPLSVLEAMAVGVPVVATAIGGTDEAIVDGVTGLLVPPGDASALTGAVRRLLLDRQFAEQLASAALLRVEERFTSVRMVESVESVYNEVLEQKTR